MSQKNVEIVRSGYEAFARGDIEGVLEIMDPEVDWDPALGPLLGVGPVRGKEALRRFLTEDIPAGFDDSSPGHCRSRISVTRCSSTRTSSGEAVPAAYPFPWRRSP